MEKGHTSPHPPQFFQASLGASSHPFILLCSQNQWQKAAVQTNANINTSDASKSCHQADFYNNLRSKGAVTEGSSSVNKIFNTASNYGETKLGMAKLQS